MRYAVISDIHGNLDSLQAVSETIETQGVDRIIFLGDAVGYGAQPSEVIDMIRSMADASVVGNHDYVASGKEEPVYFNYYAKNAVLWTRDRLSDEERTYLAGLDVSAEEEGFTIVHASPLDPLSWNYLFSVEQAEKNYDAFNNGLCFIGHTHTPGVFCMDGGGKPGLESPGPLQLKEGCRYIINAGSVGQPRDGDPRSCYVVYDAERQSVEFPRVSYDVYAAQGKIVKAGLPPYLAQRLALGM